MRATVEVNPFGTIYCGIAASRHRGIAASRHRGIAVTRAQGTGGSIANVSSGAFQAHLEPFGLEKRVPPRLQELVEPSPPA